VKTAATPSDALLEMVANAVRNEKFRIFGPSIAALGEAHLFFAQRLAMGGARVMLVWGPEADVAVDDDEHWSVADVSASFHRRSKALRVVGIADMFDIPAVAEKARSDVFAEGEVGVAFDGYPVAVVNPARLPSIWCPANDAASPDTPSIMSPSPHIAYTT
jgi:hypothetical protein